MVYSLLLMQYDSDDAVEHTEARIMILEELDNGISSSLIRKTYEAAKEQMDGELVDVCQHALLEGVDSLMKAYEVYTFAQQEHDPFLQHWARYEICWQLEELSTNRYRDCYAVAHVKNDNTLMEILARDWIQADAPESVYAFAKACVYPSLEELAEETLLEVDSVWKLQRAKRTAHRYNDPDFKSKIKKRANEFGLVGRLYALFV